MPNIDFSAKELASLKAHYVSEHQRLTVQLSHVEAMLQKLGGSVAKTSKTSKSTLTAKGVPAKKARAQEHLGHLHPKASSGKE